MPTLYLPYPLGGCSPTKAVDMMESAAYTLRLQSCGLKVDDMVSIAVAINKIVQPVGYPTTTVLIENTNTGFDFSAGGRFVAPPGYIR